MAKTKGFLTTDYTILVDSREKIPYLFDDVIADKKDKSKKILVRSQKFFLPTGDYSIEGYVDRVAVERKSLIDLFSTLGGRRDTFQNELARLQEMDFAAVAVEAEWEEVLEDPPSTSRLNPKTIWRSVIAWQQQYPGVHWNFLPGRGAAENYTFRALDRFYRQLKKAAPRESGAT